jgi:molybdenum cofactor cytidylyltransferase
VAEIHTKLATGSGHNPVDKMPGAVLLAAGFSVRFGSIKLKATLPDGNTILRKTFNNLLQATENIIVIGRMELLEQGVYDFIPALHRPYLFLCDDARLGMGHSLACGIRHIPPTWQSAMICLGDMPFVRRDTLMRLLSAGRSQNIIIPRYQSARGHPVIFGRQFFPELQLCQGDSGARHVLQANPNSIIELDIDDPGILQDIDTPQALAALCAQVTDPR